MYYIKWTGPLEDLKTPYFVGLNLSFCWGELSRARAFLSKEEAKASIKTESHWYSKVDIIFIHPLNFELRCLRDT